VNYDEISREMENLNDEDVWNLFAKIKRELEEKILRIKNLNMLSL
jgi:hypothetical protein